MIEIFFHHKKQLFVPLITYICIITGCRETILSGLPQLQFLDGADRWGQTIKKDNKLEDIPGMLTMKKKYVIMTFLSLLKLGCQFPPELVIATAGCSQGLLFQYGSHSTPMHSQYRTLGRVWRRNQSGCPLTNIFIFISGAILKPIYILDILIYLTILK